MLNILKKTENEKTIFTLEGKLDTVTAPEFEREIKSSLSQAKELILDFEKVTYISSAGLRSLLTAQKAISGRGEMKIVHVCDTVNEIFEITGFSEILTIE